MHLADRPAHPLATVLTTPSPGAPTARLTGSGTCERLTAGTGQPLAGFVQQAITRLSRLPEGLLVGLLPYPSSGTGGAPATALVFAGHDRVEGAGAWHLPDAPDGGAFRLTRPFAADWVAPGYERAVARVQDYLGAGDAYQVNLAQRFTAHYAGNPHAAWLALAAQFQPPFGAWIDLGERQVLCLSPESFLAVDGDRVTTRPIKGTRPRHADPQQDAALAADLAGHPKDRAENLMIVDLLRNDLGRVCVPGSVRVPSLFAIESFRNVHHLVSTVEGRLAPGNGVPELLAACFPGGSITGAPKRRAMEIIQELEPHPRDAYCGTIFWMTADGRFGSNIAIRTFVAGGGVMHGWAGAGIVADSDPAAEHQECLHKLAPFMRSLERLFL